MQLHEAVIVADLGLSLPIVAVVVAVVSAVAFHLRRAI